MFAQKMELTADDGNTHPGELSRITFEVLFHHMLNTSSSFIVPSEQDVDLCVDHFIIFNQSI